ncbi:MAG: MotA/TolQ/ExbB proton channel family protein [Planctomycetaceae bacterium]
MNYGDWTALLEQLSSLSTTVIVVAFAIHVCGLFILWIWAKRDLRQIASFLFDFTRGLKHQRVLDSTSHLGDQIDAFLADVNDVLDDPTRKEDSRNLLSRMRVLDEKRRYLDSMFFETSYNLARTMIEAYPLAGVLGTILAIGSALQHSAGSTEDGGVNAIVGRFGDAIWSTFAGLAAAILLMFLNSLLEPGFQRLSENRRHVRETVARAKRELALAASDDDDAPSRAAPRATAV